MSDYTGIEVAIIGMAGMFPGAKDINQFWNNLVEGKESITFFSQEELEGAGVNPALLKNPNYVKAKGYIDDIEYFDAAFFGISPGEAEKMDPQYRMFLECCWKAVEDSGYVPSEIDPSVGVYGGAAASPYGFHLIQDYSNSAEMYQAMISNDKDFLSTRVSYKMNLKGPAVTLQTACSTSLVAVHYACQGLLSGECNVALAGGVSVVYPKKSGYLYDEGFILSPDGHCRAFSKDAKGTVFGDGAGVVVLKRLEDALNDNDRIYAVIKGSAINNDGAGKVGFTAPSVDGQAEVVKSALYVADVEADSIGYIEAHGTGTTIGDVIEVSALKEVFQDGSRNGECKIGSVKTNIGHLNTAAGIAGLIKTALTVKNNTIPPSLHFTEANPKLELDSSPFKVNSTLSDFSHMNGPARAGVSSFGIGGTNAHIILEEPPAGHEGRTPIEGHRFDKKYYFIDPPGYPSVAGTQKASEQVSDNKSALHPRPELSTPYRAPESEVEELIVEIVQDVLKIEKIGIDDNYFDLGGDSLIAIQIISRLKEEFELELSVEVFFEHETVAEIAVIVEEMILAEIENEESEG